MTDSLWKQPKFIMACSLFVFSAFVALFLKIMDEVWLEQEFLLLDQFTNHLMANNHLQEPYDWRFFLTVTYLGNGVVLGVLSVLLATLLWFYRYRAESLFFIGGFGVTGLSVVMFKIVTDRIRPDGASLLNETSGAFPSGHASLALFFFGFLGYLLSRRVKKKSHSFLIFAAALLTAGFIGMSRIYLNVHWASDVLAGFALAAAILSLCIGVLETRKPLLRILLLIVLSFSFGGEAFAGQLMEQGKIDYLLTAIDSSDLVFIRENTEYSGRDARAHLQHKLEIAGWRVHMADDFIIKIASKSSLTGRPYYVQFRDGRRVEAGAWLREKLTELK